MAAKKLPIKGAIVQKRKVYVARIFDVRDRILNYGDVSDDLVEIRERYYSSKRKQLNDSNQP